MFIYTYTSSCSTLLSLQMLTRNNVTFFRTETSFSINFFMEMPSLTAPPRMSRMLSTSSPAASTAISLYPILVSFLPANRQTRNTTPNHIIFITTMNTSIYFYYCCDVRIHVCLKPSNFFTQIRFYLLTMYESKKKTKTVPVNFLRLIIIIITCSKGTISQRDWI